ncbi:TetR/AcrR family transcriptional regulator [Leptonema illini]|uniref:Regulatory protein TetR n=1 Tax=Leptonema illini DSM 21528 TaxID=929563 RepID=H2C9Z7_9LEPT|nr:TetR/AcrR family transcriptional regulator [Leptonema illini]EHQ05121.1 regulatory protein TetR [Leptonema illini DSM 21528]
MTLKRKSATEKRPERTRGPYHHGNLKAELLRVGMRLLEKEGEEALSMRRLATEIGVSPAAAYRHFESKNHLLAGLVERGFQLLIRSTLRGAEADVIAAMRRYGTGYLRFAIRHPRLYRLLFQEPLYALSDSDGPIVRSAEPAFTLLVEMCQAGIEQKAFRPQSPVSMAHAAWALVHGFAHLKTESCLPPGLDTQSDFLLAHEALLKGWS